MSGRLQEVHKEYPSVGRDFARTYLERQAREGRAIRREEGDSRQEAKVESSPSATTEELEAVRAELAARINRCLYGEGTVFDRNFIIDNLPVFEDPVGDGSVTILDLNASLA